MAGIQKHKIDYIIVATRESDYYLPSEGDCMAALLSAFPNAFELAYQAPSFRIFRPLKNMESLHLSNSGSLR
jgi:3-oxoacyl-[acyl-carrier-protein] synthase III